MKLSDIRKDNRLWKIVVLSGPNLASKLDEIGNFEELLNSWASDLGIQIEHFRSNHEGKLLEFIHASRDAADGYLVNPGGLVRVGESFRHALKDAKKPCVEVHFENLELQKKSIFSASVMTIFSGLGSSSYLGALLALVLALDELDFLHPDGTSPLNRSHGTPRSLYQ